eukprot:3187921-Rhodomonas_salina.1
MLGLCAVRLSDPSSESPPGPGPGPGPELSPAPSVRTHSILSPDPDSRSQPCASLSRRLLLGSTRGPPAALAHRAAQSRSCLGSASGCCCRCGAASRRPPRSAASLALHMRSAGLATPA